MQPSTDWIAFGPFVLHVKHRVLTQDGKAVRLNPRALELLIALLERPGEIQTKQELLDRIWRDRTVDEINLRVAVTALRRCLTAAGTGVDYILNSVGRGYGFSGSVHLEYWPPHSSESAPDANKTTSIPQGRLPLLLKPVIGRESVTGRITELLDRHRLVTIVGAAGIGKTTVAIATASRLAKAVADVRFVDFAPGRDAHLVLARIAAALTLDQIIGDPLTAIINVVADRRMLIILDNCEHVLNATAEAVAAILQNAPQVRILTTSREPLRVDGEVLYRLESLKYPPEHFAGSAQEALVHSAVQLLVERVQAFNAEFVLADALAGPAAEICRRLDGIALAIQLAAGRVATFGMFEVASRLDDRFRFLSHDTRTALPRHKTLDAAIAWSFELLTANERIVCERLSIFSGEFTLDAAIEVAGWAPVPAHDVASILANLVEKSLIIFLADQARPRYRFLETIREFARTRFRIFDSENELFRRLANRLISDCEHFVELASDSSSAEATAFARQLMDDVRYAIRRAGEIEDARLLSMLIAKAAPLMFHLGSVFELADWSGRALNTVTSPRERLELMMPYARALDLSGANKAAQISLYAEAVDIAQTLEDRDSELRARWGLSFGSGPGYSARKCLEAALAFEDRARSLGDVSATFVAESLKGQALHDLGEYRASMEAHRHVVGGYSPSLSTAAANRFGVNHRAISMSDLSEACWQVGALTEAEDWNQAAILEAGDHLPTLFVPSSQYVCRAIWEGSDWGKVAREFDSLTQRFNVGGGWKNWIRNLGAIIEIQQNGNSAAFGELDADILSGRWQGLTDRYIWIVVHFIQCCMTLGKMEHAFRMADQLVSTLQDRQARWMMPEALRLKALTLVDAEPAEATACFAEARASATALGASNFAKYIEVSYDACRNRLTPRPRASVSD